jgi:hypothetical protein
MVVYFLRGSTPTAPRLWLFGRPATLRPIRKARLFLTPCDTCFQYHSAGGSTCRCTPRCSQCGQAHNTGQEPCLRPARCVNCLGPHISSTPDCPARPRQDNGVIRRLDRRQLRAVRSAGTRAWHNINSQTQPQAYTSESDSSAQLSTSTDSSSSQAGARILPINREEIVFNSATKHRPSEESFLGAPSTLTPGFRAPATEHPSDNE